MLIAENRTKAVETLRTKKLRLDSETVALTVMPFGIPDEAACTLWTVRGGYGDTVEKIAGAIRSEFSGAKETEAFFSTVAVKSVSRMIF